MKLPKGYLDMGRAEYADLSKSVQRAVYTALREIVVYTVGNDNANSVIRQAVEVLPGTAVAWIIAIKSVEVDCKRCKGTGIYYWGASINGKMSCSGPCARCGGDGRMTFDDMRRCRAYDNYSIVRACRG